MYGAACGVDDVVELIEGKLPRIARQCGEELPKHRLASPSHGTDVVAPDGTKVHFDISLDDDDISLDDNGKIKALTRLPIE